MTTSIGKGEGSTPQKRFTRAEVSKAIVNNHQDIKDAVHGVLAQAGLQGVNLHSVRFTLARDAAAEPGCNPPCGPNEICVIDSSGGVAKWVCIPG